MTLAIALIANSIHVKIVGEQYLATSTIILLWVLHVIVHSGSSSK